MEDKSLKKAIAKTEYERGKMYLQGLEKEQKKPPKKYYMIAASIVALLGICFSIYLFNTNNANTEELFANNFKPYDNIVIPISRDDAAKSKKERAFYYYESEQYDKSLKIFDSLLLDNSIDISIINFYKANIFLQQQTKLDEAIGLLESNINNTDKWKDKNLWYLSLAYLKQNKSDKAFSTLKKIEKLNSNFKKTQRLNLLKALK